MIEPIYRNPLQFAAAITANFIRGYVPEPSATLLDVGCGDGLVALELVKSGMDVLVIDGHLESVNRAREIGINAKHCRLNQFDHKPFDLVFVSRALHHMPPLAETICKLHSLVRPGGHLVIEEFGFELVERRAAAWLIGQTTKIKENHVIDTSRHHWLLNATGLAPETALEGWLDHHFTKHHLLRSDEMKQGLAEHFEIETCTAAAYLFRYLCDFLPDTAHGAQIADGIRQDEAQRIAAEEIPAVGLRMVLRRPKGAQPTK